MNLNRIIYKKRKELSLTQEQVAEYLGVSTPAVNKWEKGSTYPDITLLPALARLLKTDLNTLLSFSEDLTDAEIEKFVNALDRIVQEQGFASAFQIALDKIHQYPTCDALILSSILYLEGALTLYNVPDPDPYRKVFKTFYERLAVNDTPEIRTDAISMLISYARNEGDFSRAEELINELPSSPIDREEQLAILYRCQEKYEDAQKIWERRILKGVTNIQTALMNMIEWSLLEKHDQDAEYFADLYATITHDFCFPEWMCYNAHLQIALEKQERERSLVLLKKMIPAMKKGWQPQNCRLYHNANDSGDSTFLSSRLAESFCIELSTNKEYAFLRDGSDLDELIADIKNQNTKP